MCSTSCSEASPPSCQWRSMLSRISFYHHWDLRRRVHDGLQGRDDMTRSQTYVVSRVLFYLVLAIIFLYIVFPFYWAFRSSITPDGELFVTPVHYWPQNPTLAHYEDVFSNGDFLIALRNSAIVAASTTLLSLVIGTVGAYALGRFKFRGRLPVMYLILSMTMFPSIAILGSLFDLVRRFGL